MIFRMHTMCKDQRRGGYLDITTIYIKFCIYPPPMWLSLLWPRSATRTYWILLVIWPRCRYSMAAAAHNTTILFTICTSYAPKQSPCSEQWRMARIPLGEERRDSSPYRANLEIIHKNPKISKWMEDFRDLSVCLCMYFFNSNSVFKSLFDHV